MNRCHPGFILILSLNILVSACGVETSDSVSVDTNNGACTPGEAACECVDSAVCDEGLECLDGVCVLDEDEGDGSCADEPCLNGSTCVPADEGFICECPEGFVGNTCEIDLDECSPNPCLNDGECVDGVASFTCECPEGFEGDTCETEINTDDCAENPCLNEGECTDGIDSFTCECVDGFEGDTCEINTDDCAQDPCLNEGECIDGVDSFTCECVDGFEGDTCEINTDDCAQDPCLNEGECVDGVDSFTCECVDGFEGDLCGTNIDDCAQDPCLNEGECTDGVNSFTCECADGFEGDTCETNIDDCAQDPCLNEGECSDGVNSFTCECVDGFEGELCGTNIDDCAQNPCLNEGECTDGIDSFTCECVDGFEGDTCETNIDDCAQDPCLNEGECIDGVDSFTCECADGFEGELCGTNIDDCAQNPCLNEGECTDGIDSFTCECVDGFEGDTCADCVGGDTDNDGICNPDDACPEDFDDGTDTDEDGLPDACDCIPDEPLTDEICDGKDNDCNDEIDDLEGFCFVVDTLDDTNDASSVDEDCIDANGNCSLRAALEELATEAEGGIIFLPDNTYSPTSGEVWEVIGRVTIRGESQAGAIVDFAEGEGFLVTQAFDLHLESLTLQNATDSAIECEDCDEITLFDTRITANSTEGNGGAIEIIQETSDITLTISDSTIDSNSAVNGAGIYLDLIEETFGAEINISNSTFLDNDASSTGGQMYLDSRGSIIPRTVTITNTTFEEGSASSASGIFLKMSAGEIFTAEDTRFIRNSSGSNGGALVFTADAGDDPAQMTLTRCFFNRNSADQGGGIRLQNSAGAWNIDIIDTAFISGRNGALVVGGTAAHNILLQNSSILGDTSGGTAAMKFTNTTNTSLILDHVTIAHNSVASNTAGIKITALDSLTLRHTIISDNDDRDGVDELTDNFDLSNIGTITSEGYNLLSNVPEGLTALDTDIFGVEGDFVSADLNDLVTTDTTAYREPNPGSPAVDVIPAEDIDLDTDQRGVARPQGITGDIGAIEFQSDI